MMSRVRVIASGSRMGIVAGRLERDQKEDRRWSTHRMFLLPRLFAWQAHTMLPLPTLLLLLPLLLLSLPTHIHNLSDQAWDPAARQSLFRRNRLGDGDDRG